MRYPIALVALMIVLSSCSSAFRTGQTPDDVYYSYGAAPVVRENAKYADDDERYRSYWQNSDDNYVRMRVRDRNRWAMIDDIDYWYGYNNSRSFYNPAWSVYNYNSPYFNRWAYSPFGYNNFGFGWNSWNNPWMFNSFYNSWNSPWMWNQPVVIINKYPTVPQTNMRPAYRSAYNTSLFDRYNSRSTNNSRSYQSIWRNSGGYNGTTTESSSRPGRYFEPNNTQTRSSSSSSSSGSSRSSGSSSSGSRPGRGGN